VTILQFLMGLALLVSGAEVLVRGASRLAARLGVSSLVVGLTVVAFGTSFPEVVVSVDASLRGESEIATGNVVGSNIFNVLFILGLTALLVPLRVSSRVVRVEVPLLVLVSLAVLGMAFDGNVTRGEGLLLVAGLGAYTLFLWRRGRRGDAAATAAGRTAPDGEIEAPSDRKGSVLTDGLSVVVGLVFLVGGARLFVGAAVALAEWLGISEVVTGLTIVAAGTSMPEVLTSIVAALRGERDIAVGNVIGSNLFNLLGVLGVVAVAAPSGLEIPSGLIAFDLPVMVAVAVFCLPIGLSGAMISRLEGAILLGYYGAYTLYVILEATGHERADDLRAALLYFVVPITTVTSGVMLFRALRRRC